MDWAKQRVVVTGGGGFLGTHVVQKLRAAGCEPFVVRRREYDLIREEQVIRLFEEHPADIVVHLAGLVGGNLPNQRWPAQFFYENLMMGTLTLHYSWKSGAKKFICAGAGCAYPEHAPLPLREENYWDGFPQQPSFAYALAKRTLHVQSMAYWDEYKFPAIVTLPGNIYGPHDNFDLENAHVLPALVRKFVEASAIDRGKGQTVVVWGSGKPARDFVYVRDVVEGMLRAAEVYDRAELVNLSCGRECSIREVVETLATITGFEGEIAWDVSKAEGQSHRMFDMSKAERDLGFCARTSLHEGLRLTVEWYREHTAVTRKEVDTPIYGHI
ncbi:GDP-L-fucose synthase [Candidatus Sulfotelmatomonas gaucii]|uniref:GDP-L-fucose synthase n=1 Tax=Candidatus Sulfuritelmatomonas gaucii TaxID=2043161 RepID=A0A2N9MA45_9BACT|nr:GDP-L-fucose synthase [Candidatus Sulfotelmatomonas gaucii]